MKVHHAHPQRHDPGLRLTLLGITAIAVPMAFADLPETGYEVDQLTWIDDAMQEFMEDDDNDINGGLIGIMKDGVIVYQRGFGWMDEAQTVPLPENALVRLASATKSITAAAIHRLETDGLLCVKEYVFDRGQPKELTDCDEMIEGGIIDVEPFLTTLEHQDWVAAITVDMCLTHQAGWDYLEEEDAVFRACEIASTMDIESPPLVDQTIEWLAGREPHFEPGHGDGDEYSNQGYLVLGKIVELLSGMDVVTYHQTRVLTPEMWVPATDLLLGETFFDETELREPWYDCNSTHACVFPRDGHEACAEDHTVDYCYGGWDMATFFGSGGLVASAGTMLELAERYCLPYGEPKTGPTSGGKSGNMPGTSTYVYQRSEDGVNVFIFFNKQINGRSAMDFYNDVLSNDERSEHLGNQDSRGWPTMDIGGFWIDLNELMPLSAYGSYDYPYAGLASALTFLGDGSRVNIKPGSSDWIGTISTKLLLRAPLGTATIGEP